MAFKVTKDSTTSTIRSPEVPITEYIKTETDKVDTITEFNILGGFDYEKDGETYHINFDQYDQINFLMKILDVVLAKIRTAFGDPAVAALDAESPTYSWQATNSKGENVTLQFTEDEFIAFAYMAGRTKERKLANGWVAKDTLRACKDRKTLRVTTEKMGLDRAYSDAVYASKK